MDETAGWTPEIAASMAAYAALLIQPFFNVLVAFYLLAFKNVVLAALLFGATVRLSLLPVVISERRSLTEVLRLQGEARERIRTRNLRGRYALAILADNLCREHGHHPAKFYLSLLFHVTTCLVFAQGLRVFATGYSSKYLGEPGALLYSWMPDVTFPLNASFLAIDWGLPGGFVLAPILAGVLTLVAYALIVPPPTQHSIITVLVRLLIPLAVLFTLSRDLAPAVSAVWIGICLTAIVVQLVTLDRQTVGFVFRGNMAWLGWTEAPDNKRDGNESEKTNVARRRSRRVSRRRR